MKKRVSLLTLAVVFFAAGFAPTAAMAHRIYVGWTQIYTDHRDLCLKGKVTTDHGSTGNGYFQYEGQGFYVLPTGNCNVNSPESKNAGGYRITLAAWKTNAPQNCIDTGWVYNATVTDYMKINRPKNPGSPYSSPPCGSGNYWTKGRFQGLLPSGSWTGSTWLLTDQAHSLPTTPGGSGG
jgi:hypothetical protein